MGRRKQTKKCYGCGVAFTWEKGANNANGVFVPNPAGAVRAVEVTTGQIHYCSNKRDNINPDSQPTTQPEPEPMPEFPTVNPEPATEPEPVPMPVQPLTDHGITLTPAGMEIYKLIEPILKLKFDELARNSAKTVHHVVDVNVNGVTKRIEGCHRQQEELLEILAMRENALLTGPAGTGKSTAAKNAANALGLNFWPLSIGVQTSKSDFFGFVDAHGRAAWTIVREAYVNGGVLLLDEVDASGPAITYMNSMLANDKATFPLDVDDTRKTATFDKHADFCVVGTTNTLHGATRDHGSRQPLDIATLDRFMGIEWEYDTDLELRIGTEYGHTEWVKFVWALRQAQAELSVRRAVFGTRKIISGCKALHRGMSRDRVERRTVWFGVSVDDKAKLLARIAQNGGVR